MPVLGNDLSTGHPPAPLPLSEWLRFAPRAVRNAFYCFLFFRGGPPVLAWGGW